MLFLQGPRIGEHCATHWLLMHWEPTSQPPQLRTPGERERGGVIRLRLYIRWEASAKPRLAIKQQQQQPKRQPRPAPPRAAPPRVSRSPPQPSGSGPHATLQVSLGVHGVTGGEHVAPSDEQL